MEGLTTLTQIELIPVVEVPPGVFPSSPDIASQSAEEDGCWPEEPAAGEVTTVYPTAELADLEVIIRFLESVCKQGADDGEAARGADSKLDVETIPYLDGGLVLRSGDEILVEPGCCADLGNLASWREAAAYRGDEWQTIWIGHPWICVRYEQGILLLSEASESEARVARWAVRPDHFVQALAQAEAELEAFAQKLQAAAEALGAPNPEALARRLAGLST